MRLNAATWAGRTALAAAAAITVAIAAIAVLSAAPASAQSDDETAGRIVARLLDDGRVEFGWQPAGGARVLPRQRYFPTDATVDRWLRSSPVEVGGSAIGRINARLLDDGRIEFAFTPTDGERITPQARYFPAGTRVGRWLRSTEITIGPPEDAAPGFTAISAGDHHACAIRGAGAIECWGYNNAGQTDAPDGRFTAVSVALIEGRFTCAIRASTSAIECWGQNEYRQTDAPDGTFTAVSAGRFHACGLRDTGAIECWGDNILGQGDAPESSFIAVSAGFGYTCAIRDRGAIECWGSNFDWQGQHLGQSDPPQGTFTAVSAGFWHACAIRENGEIACWGDNEHGQTDAPDGSYIAVSARNRHTCAIRESDSAIECWGGDNFYGQRDALPGSYTAVAVGGYHTCAIRTNGEIACWGWNNIGQATPPTE